MEARIAVASASLGSGFAGLMYSYIRKLLQPGQSIVECAISARADDEYVRGRLLKLFEEDPRPTAFIGICLRPDPPTIERFRGWGVPAVLVDEQAEGATTVATDNHAGGYLVGKYLAEQGRKHLALVSGELHINGGYAAMQRARGFAQACAEHGLPFSIDDAVQIVEYTRRDGVTALTQILREGRRVDAIFCAAGDATATGILSVARDHRIQVPEELAVVGFDDSPLAAISTPPLTTVKQSAHEMAVEAHRLATTGVAEALERPRVNLLEPKLVVRGSA